MSKRIILDYLGKVNSANLNKADFSSFDRLMLSTERRLLSREATKQTEYPKREAVDDGLWNRISAMHENYRHLEWKKRGMKLNLLNPTTLAEKLEWLKFNDHSELHIQLCDKLAVRDYVTEKIGGANLLNKIIFKEKGYNATCEIPFEHMPERFVIKTNHWSGDALICNDDEPIQPRQLEQIDLRLSRRYGGYHKSEWPYWHIEPKVFIEEYLEDRFGQLVDYKIFCFNSEPKFIMVCTDRFGNHKRLFFAPDWTLLPFADWKYPPIEKSPEMLRPDSLDEMLQHAATLSEGMGVFASRLLRHFRRMQVW